MYKLISTETGEEYRKSFSKLRVARRYAQGCGHTGVLLSPNRYAPRFVVVKDEGVVFTPEFPHLVSGAVVSAMLGNDHNICG